MGPESLRGGEDVCAVGLELRGVQGVDSWLWIDVEQDEQSLYGLRQTGWRLNIHLVLKAVKIGFEKSLSDLYAMQFLLDGHVMEVV